MTKLVLVSWRHPLFHHSVCRLLESPAIHIVGACQHGTDPEEAMRALQPDTIIIETADDNGSCLEIIRRLQLSLGDVRILCANLTDNIVWAFRQERHVLETAEDLRQLVLDA